MKFDIGQIVYSRYACSPSISFDPVFDPFGTGGQETVILHEGQSVRVVDSYTDSWVKVSTDFQEEVWVACASVVDHWIPSLTNLISDYWLNGSSITIDATSNWAGNYVYIPNTASSDYISIGAIPTDASCTFTADTVEYKDKK